MATFISDTGVERKLSVGEFAVGRGPVLQITDKRVSRNHALVRIEENGSVSICSKHSNPCYYKSVSSDKYIQLQRDVWQKLDDGDSVSMLHYSIKELVYTVRLERGGDKKAIDDSNTAAAAAADSTSSDIPDHTNIKPAATVSSLVDRSQPSSSSSRSADISNKRSRKLPAWLEDIGVSDKKLSPPKRKTPATTKPAKVDTTDRMSPIVNTSPTDTVVKKEKKGASAVGKRELKKADSVKDGKTAVAAVSNKEDDQSAANNTTDTTKKKALPQCPYGTKCYRKNPAHFLEFSHDFDSSPDKEEKGEEKEEEEEDGDEEKPECPYGTSCYRKNPLHRQQFSHTKTPTAGAAATDERKRTRTSTRSTRGKKNKKSALAGDSDDEGEPNTYDYNDSFIDDAEEESSSSSYGADSDEDADWVAPMEDSSEDINELVSDAKEFMANKKMHK